MSQQHQTQEDHPPLEPNLEAIDPRLLEAMMAVLAEHPDGSALPNQVQLDLCIQAIEGGHFSNKEWLDEAIQAHKSEHPQEASNKPSFQPVPLTDQAAPQCQEDLIPILLAHSQWLESVLNPQKTIEGGRANLKGADLSGFDLKGLDLRGANLQEANFSNAELQGANLSTANLKEASFHAANLAKAVFKRANLEGATFDSCDLNQTDFRRSNLKNVTWDESDTSSALFEPSKDETSAKEPGA